MSEGLFDEGLFGATDEEKAERIAANAPLAVRMRPRSLDEVVGQEHLLGPGAPLRRLVEGAAPGLGDALRPARHRQDDARHPGLERDRPAVRRAVGVVRRA